MWHKAPCSSRGLQQGAGEWTTEYRWGKVMEMMVKMAEVLVKIAVMMMAPGGGPAPPGERRESLPLLLLPWRRNAVRGHHHHRDLHQHLRHLHQHLHHLPPSIYSGPLSRNPLYPLLEHGALCFILLSNDVLPSYDVWVDFRCPIGNWWITMIDLICLWLCCYPLVPIIWARAWITP